MIDARDLWTFSLFVVAYASSSSQLIGQEAITLKGHEGCVTCLAYSPDGKCLASGSHDKTIRLWDTRTNKNVATFDNERAVTSIAYSPDGTMLASGGSDKSIRVWNVETRKVVKVLSGHTDSVTSIVFSDPKVLVTGSDDKTVRLWNIPKEKETGRIETKSNVVAVALANEGSVVLVANEDRRVTAWKLASLESDRTCFSVHRITCMAYGGANSFCIGDTEGHVQLSRLGKRVDVVDRKTKAHANETLALAVAPTGSLIASSSYTGSKETSSGEIKLWTFNRNEQTIKQCQALKGHKCSVKCLAFSLDEKLLASGGWDGVIMLWKVSPATK